MKVLWLTNLSLPEVDELMGENISPFGGWIVSASKGLTNQKNNINLSIAFPSSKLKEVNRFNGKKIKYFSFPNVDVNDDISIRNNMYLKSIVMEVQPDLVHIFGTEFAHSLAMVNVCKELDITTAINIQGLVSVIAKHYNANLPIKVLKRFTFRDFIKRDNILKQKEGFVKRGFLEIETIQKTNHIIGRTTWDKACTSQINPAAQYHFCNETLREEFYKKKWQIDKCVKYSIFLSQASYPIKGLHYVLEALPLIIERYPEVKLYIAGPDITSSSTLKQRLKKTSYVNYICELVKNYNLEEYIYFTGVLSEEQMCEQYLQSNVFICPSSIENSSNSLAEAMILGVPCVASNVGGISDMLQHKEEGFIYQSDAPYMLAYYVCEIFENNDLALNFSEKARERAMNTHDPVKNANRLIEIYNDIVVNIN